MCALRHQLCDDSVIHQMRLSRPKQKYALAPGALSRETNYAAYASAAASGHYRLPNNSQERTHIMDWTEFKGRSQERSRPNHSSKLQEVAFHMVESTNKMASTSRQQWQCRGNFQLPRRADFKRRCYGK